MTSQHARQTTLQVDFGGGDPPRNPGVSYGGNGDDEWRKLYRTILEFGLLCFLAGALLVFLKMRA